jgi:flagellar basal body-associated protein FliL
MAAKPGSFAFESRSNSRRPLDSCHPPKVYDALLTYLRTLTDAEVENSLAIDRIRGDIFRRLTLLLGPNIVRDVLITSLVIA